MNPASNELLTARRESYEAILAAELAEKEARQLRNTANQKQRRYEQLLLEHNGQLALPITVTQAHPEAHEGQTDKELNNERHSHSPAALA
jgi:hypothetical protein